MVKFLPGASATLIESIPSKVHDAEGIHERPRARCEAGRPARFEHLIGSARDHVREPGGTAAIVDGHHVQDDGDDYCRRMGCGATRAHPRR